MIETRIAHQLNRIAGAAAAAVQSNNTITNIVEFAIIALFQFKIVVIAHTNCLPKFCFRCFERDERKIPKSHQANCACFGVHFA